MPKSTLQTARESIAYSDKFLADTYYMSEHYLGSANVKDVSQSSYISRHIYITFSYSGSEKKNPLITQSNLIEIQEEEVQELIYRLKTSSVLCRDKIANRLITLFKDSKEEDPYSPAITPGSLRNFIKFLELYPNVKYPSISLTPEHNIYVSWRDQHNRIFSVHFLPNGDTRFVIFTPNYRHPERKIRVSGITTVDVLIEETVAPYRVNWIFDER